MSLREIARRAPDTPAPDIDQCPGCRYFDSAQAHYPAEDFPTIARNLARRQAQHITDGECLVMHDADE
ncbi:hypothetical protein ACFVX9_22300 [Kitasatospora sp. NPDC058243]|uniref:hypothetical protein n=1 Tax=Kitasatospora sp. NPDC058243 TaxID=3346397 RepID=UPI0036DA92D3